MALMIGCILHGLDALQGTRAKPGNHVVLYKYRPQIGHQGMPACPGDLQACPPTWPKVKGKCAGVPSIFILQPVAGVTVRAHHSGKQRSSQLMKET